MPGLLRAILVEHPPGGPRALHTEARFAKRGPTALAEVTGRRGEFANHPEYRQDLAGSHNDLGNLLRDTKRYRTEVRALMTKGIDAATLKTMVAGLRKMKENLSSTLAAEAAE